MGYSITATSIFLFFITVNVSLTWIVMSGVLPVNFELGDDPSKIQNMFLSVDFSIENLLLAGVGLSISTLLGKVAGNLLTGGALGVGIFALTMFVPIVKWVLFGFPQFLNLIGVPVYISAGVMALLVVPLFFTVLSFIAQRPIEGHG